MSEINMINYNYSDVENWKAGYFDARSGVYKTDLKYYICVNELIPVTPDTYKVKISNSKYSINIASFDKNKKFINNVVLIGCMKDLKTTLKSNTRYVGISITDMKTSSTPESLLKAIQNGLKFTFTKSTPDPVPVYTYEKVDYGSLNPNTATLEEKKEFVIKLFDKIVTTGNDHRYNISALKLNNTDHIVPWFDEYKAASLDNRIKLSCMENPFMMVDDAKAVNYLYIMSPGENAVAYYNKVKSIIAELSKVIKDMPTDLDKILYVHEYLVANTTYDSNTPGCGNGGCLLARHKGMCAAFADAMTIILLSNGVNSDYYGSTPMNHGWNRIPYEGENYHIDNCWDNTRSKTDHMTHRYFMRSDDEMRTIKPTHYNFYPHYAYPSVQYDTSGVNKATSNRFSKLYIHDVKGRMWYNNGLWYYYDEITNSIKENDVFGTKERVVLKSDKFTIKLISVEDGLLNFELDGNKFSIKI